MSLIHEPASIVTLLIILVLSISPDYWWKRSSASKAKQLQVVQR